MSKKRLITLILTVSLVFSSTAVIAFASQKSADTTKNVVKVAGDKVETTVKDSISESSITKDESKNLISVLDETTINATLTKEELNQRLRDIEDGKMKASPETIKKIRDIIKVIETAENVQSVKAEVKTKSDQVSNPIKEYTAKVDSNVKLLNISDAQAIKTAKDAIKNYTGLDIEKVIIKDGLKPTIFRNSSIYAWGPDIMVNFYNKKTTDNIHVSISTVDGKVYGVTAILPSDTSGKAQVDKSKVREAALRFLEDKGFGVNVKSITFNDEKVSIGLSEVKCLYADGTEIMIEFAGVNNSVVNFTHYNLKTMKFLK